MNPDPSILGIDPSLRGTGVAVIYSTHHHVLKIKTYQERWDVAIPMIAATLLEKIRNADIIAIESPILARGVGGSMTGAMVAGAVLSLVIAEQRPYAYITPQRLRSFYGLREGSGKLSVQLDKFEPLWRQLFPPTTSYNGYTPDEIDALGLAFMVRCLAAKYLSLTPIISITEHQASVLDKLTIVEP